MPTTHQASARPHAHTMGQFTDRMAIRNQSVCLAHSILNAVQSLDALPITPETNAAFMDVRDQLSDLLAHIQAVREGGAQ